MIIDDIIDVIRKSEKIGITYHVSPDGDALGSSLALMQGLLKLGKEVYIMSKDILPENFGYLPSSLKIDKNNCCVLENTDTVIVLDCGNVERISSNMKFQNSNYTLINIDHHLSNDLYGDLNYVNAKAAATAEIVYELLNLMDVFIDKDIATCLYTALITDTGSFKHSNTTPLTHNIAANLINTGIDFSQIHRNIFENMNFSRLKLHGRVIDNMFLVLNEEVCVMELTQKLLDEFELDKADTSDIISIGTKINTVEVTLLLKESQEGTKVSLRSKSKVDVRKIAEVFGGGGHIRASGFLCKKSLEITKKLLIKEIEKELIK
ncbi:bifunctional oligoribonuclease/PAP phosphatase NrnA [Clostridium aestuarii]|uniref:Bifunctional oligoribonuclease/PAP phosphatase NrnA n=1 Tax=Clostridium aestuarii TaxID=338193 RepID=A0ABT4CY68_9CLOT|nr:bifunctional oligoribonuclease/PAP phosphatase NrnA [Clostridium aestuarii]MCY6483929.1 bifunctional oligoribonuclease/PAP phosphatase NrnA [Clostridium aestuarii]